MFPGLPGGRSPPGVSWSKTAGPPLPGCEKQKGWGGQAGEGSPTRRDGKLLLQRPLLGQGVYVPVVRSVAHTTPSRIAAGREEGEKA